LVLLSTEQADRLTAAVAAGAQLLVTYFSGIADRTDRVITGGYPGLLRELLGVRSEEFFPLGPDQLVRWDDETVGTTWTEATTAAPGTEVVVSYADGPAAGAAALTRRRVGDGTAWYLSGQPDAAGFARVMARLLAAGGVRPAVVLPAGHPAVLAGEIDVVRRRSATASWVFAINHSTAEVELPVSGWNLLTDGAVTGTLLLPGGACAVVRET
jgi:beta-galactosidase